MDELAWGAGMLLLATGDDAYRTKVDAVWDYPFNKHDPDYFLDSGGPISWDDKRALTYAIMYVITDEDKYKTQAVSHSDRMASYKTTPGGLWFDTDLSVWGSNRYACDAAFTVAMVASVMDKSDSKRDQYVKFIQKQVDYIQGDNPAKVNYIVGAEPSSPKSVHHRGASGTMSAMEAPHTNIFPLYGALAGGPDAGDKYKDDRTDYNANEVALDYNAAYTGLLAFLIQEGLNVPDPEQTWDGAWPPKEKQEGKVVLKVKNNGQNEFATTLSTTGGLVCGGWCVEVDLSNTGASFGDAWGGDLLKSDDKSFVICSTWGKDYLDGKGTEVDFSFRAKASGEATAPAEAIVYCSGYKRGDPYLVKTDGSSCEPYGWTKGICKPAHICDANGKYIKDSGVINKSKSSGSSGGSSSKTAASTPATTTKASEPSTSTSSSTCFASKLGYSCCTGCEVTYTDDDGAWGLENGEWCGIPDSCNDATPAIQPEQNPSQDECFSSKLGYPCCNGCEVTYADDDGEWGLENGEWCGIKSTCNAQSATKTCFSEPNYPCCSESAKVEYTDDEGSWGVENGQWCGIGN